MERTLFASLAFATIALGKKQEAYPSYFFIFQRKTTLLSKNNNIGKRSTPEAGHAALCRQRLHHKL